MQNRECLKVLPIATLAIVFWVYGCGVNEELLRLCEIPLPPPLPVSQIEKTEGITYTIRGDRSLKLDMFSPKPVSGLLYPAVICLHGGGWVGGHRTCDYIQAAARYLAIHGYVAVVPTYRLAPEFPYPAAVADVRDCIRWLRRRAGTYRIDPQRIGALGVSAGGHLACMLGTAADNERFGPEDGADGNESSRVRAVVNFFGPSDLTTGDCPIWTTHLFVIPFMGDTLRRRPDRYREASPTFHLTPDDAPILTFQGTADLLVPPAQATRLHKKLDELGIANRLILLAGQGHGWAGRLVDQTQHAAVAFLNEHLRVVTETRPAAIPSSGPVSHPAN